VGRQGWAHSTKCSGVHMPHQPLQNPITDTHHSASPPQAAPKFLGRQGAHWTPLDDGWTFNLAVRPPTQGLDLLTDYLEVKYR
jgi:hypothetical protein